MDMLYGHTLRTQALEGRYKFFGFTEDLARRGMCLFFQLADGPAPAGT